MAYENYTVKQYMNAMYRKDYSETGISEEELKVVHSEYIDTAGLYDEDEFDRVSYIHYLNGRINTINLGISLHHKFINEFNTPFLNSLSIFKKYGYILNWNGDKNNFLTQIERIEFKEKKYISILENKIKELLELRKSKESKSEKVSTEKSRGSFIRILISLGKMKFVIDKDKTTVEELAWMIKMQKDEAKEIKTRK